MYKLGGTNYHRYHIGSILQFQLYHLLGLFFFAVATENLKGKKRPSQCNKMVLGVSVLLSTFT